MNKQRLLSSAALAIATLLVPALACAQSQTQSSQHNLVSDAQSPPQPEGRWRAGEVVIVTGTRAPSYRAPVLTSGTRTPTPMEEVPQSIQALTAGLIQDQDLQTLPEALANVSNVMPATIFEVVTRDTIIRGFDAATYFDGLPAYGLTAVTAPTSLINLERIEVAKGPSATLFGGGTGAPLSGLINLVSKSPQTDLRIEAAVRLGSDNAFGIEGDVNLPLIADKVLLRVTGDFDTADSFIAAIESQSWTFNPTLAVILSDATRLTLRAQISNLEQLEYSGLPASLAFAPSLGVDPFGFTGSRQAPRTKVENSLYTATLDHRVSANLSGSFSVRHYDSRFDEYATTPFFIFPRPTPTSAVFLSAYLPTDVQQSFATGTLMWSLGGGRVKHTVLMGIEGDTTDYYAQLGFAPLGALDYKTQQNTPWVLPTLSDAQNDKLSTFAVFIQDQIKIGDRLDITAGLRWTKLDIDTLYTSGGVTFVDLDRSEKKVSPRLGATFRIIDGVSVFAGWSEGFQGLVTPFGVADPKPEESQAYDAGVKFATPIAGLSGTVSAYQVTRQNVTTSDPNNLFAAIQTGEQRSTGAEIDVIYEPARTLSVLLSWGWNDTEVTRDNRLAIGSRPARVPEQSGRVAARYRFLDGALKGLEIGGGLTHIGARFLTLPNALKAEAFTTLDAQAAWQFGGTTLSASITNLTDADHFEPYAYLNQAVVIPAKPRSLAITLRRTF
jgi:iron complex outermembrane recepter protein